MKAIVQDEYGSAGVLRLDDVETPVAGRGEVLIRVVAASAFIGDRLHGRTSRVARGVVRRFRHKCISVSVTWTVCRLRRAQARIARVG